MAPTSEDYKDDAITAILARFPQAHRAVISSSDQGSYGYVLDGITLADGTEVGEAEVEDLGEELWDTLGNVSWGSFGDPNSVSSLTISLPEGRWIKGEAAPGASPA